MQELGFLKPPRILFDDAAVNDDHNEVGDALDEPDRHYRELLLACVSSSGKVYWYRPLALLQQYQDQLNQGQLSHPTQGRDFVEDLAQLLLGDFVFSDIQKSFALSQPLQQVTLSMDWGDQCQLQSGGKPRQRGPNSLMNDAQGGTSTFGCKRKLSSVILGKVADVIVENDGGQEEDHDSLVARNDGESCEDDDASDAESIKK